MQPDEPEEQVMMPAFSGGTGSWSLGQLQAGQEPARAREQCHVGQEGKKQRVALSQAQGRREEEALPHVRQKDA